MHVYRNVTTGQTVESEDRLPRLDGLARWERTEQATKPTPKRETKPAEDDPSEPSDTVGGDAGPRRTARSRKASK